MHIVHALRSGLCTLQCAALLCLKLCALHQHPMPHPLDLLRPDMSSQAWTSGLHALGGETGVDTDNDTSESTDAGRHVSTH